MQGIASETTVVARCDFNYPGASRYIRHSWEATRGIGDDDFSALHVN